MKKVWVRLSAIMVLCILLGWAYPLMSFGAELSDLSGNITEMVLNSSKWTYGDNPVSVKVMEGEAVYTQIVAYYTKTQWRELRGGKGSVELKYRVPEGVEIRKLESSLVAEVEGKEEKIGELSRGSSDSELLIRVTSEYAERMEANDNIEIRMEVLLEFQKGIHDLGTQFVVTADSSGSSSARWNNYMVRLNKIDVEWESQLLGDACFELSVLEQKERATGEYRIIEVTDRTFLANDTFLVSENRLVTVPNQAAELCGMFEPGNIYRLTEVRSPIGYLPMQEPALFAFCRYSDTEKQGTQKRLEELNEEYRAWYAEFNGKVAVFEEAKGGSGILYLKNRKVPSLQIRKLEKETGQPMSGVRFLLKAKAAEMDYPAEQYLNCGGNWSYDSESGLLTWELLTDQNGICSLPAGTLPYAANGIYTLEETVPAGYAGFGAGRTKEITFRLVSDGTLQILSGDCEVGTWDQGMELIVRNSRATMLEINKVNLSDEVLEGAEFALYGPDKTDSETMTINGKTWYLMGTETTGKDGKAVFYDLSYQTYYLVEKKAPPGYAVLASPFQVNLTEEGEQNGVTSVKIVDKVDLVMPDMGRKGKPFWMAAPIGIAAGCAGLILTKRRRRSRS